MRNKNVQFVVEIAIYSAIALVLDFLASLYSKVIWPMSGSISIAMIPIFITAYKYGLKGGLLTGLITGSLQILWAGGGTVHPVQIILEYPVAYMLVGVAGIFKSAVNKNQGAGKLFYLSLGGIIGGGLRLIIHIIAGIIYFKAYTPDGLNVIGWSVIYNMGYMIPSIIISIVCVIILQKRLPHLIK